VPILAYIIVALAAYLLGSIPTGYLVARAKGVDIRTVGSGNIGATNAFRVLGKPAGVYLALAPVAVGIAIAVWIALFVTTRYVSVASLAAAVALPTAVWLTQDSVLLGFVTTGLGVLAIYKHKGNIQRLLAGTENRVNFKKEKPAS
jgi:glycerol-3-phosphate acyltransferase PlsY